MSRPEWIVNIQVPRNYGRTDLDNHVREVAQGVDLDGAGVGLLTAAQVSLFGVGEERGLRVEATAGVSHPTWAAHPASAAENEPGAPAAPGTVNIVVRMPVELGVAAAVNAVATVTEAKTQAFFERGIPGTGTPTDTVTIVWVPTSESTVEFCGPRSPWGAAIARATHDAVGDAIDRSGFLS